MVAGLAACEPKPRPVRVDAPAVSRVEQTIELPGGDGRVHVIKIPNGMLEATRCVVAIGPAGIPSTACTPKDLDMPVERD